MSQATNSSKTSLDEDFVKAAAAQRRKVRKGTHSCWECRQRKMKCTFNQPTDDTCTRCDRRGIKCVSQEYPEEITPSLERNLQMGDRMARVEKLLDRLLDQKLVPKRDHPAKDIIEEQNNTVGSSAPSSEDTLTAALLNPLTGPESSGFDIIDGHAQSPKPEGHRTAPAENTRYERLSRVLHAFLPSPEDTKAIVKACGNTSSLFYQMHIVPYADLDEERSLEAMFTRPNPTVHPILIAKHMLNIATALQHLHPDFAKDVGLSEPPRETMRRLAMLAINAVTTNDDLVDCIEGLDCMLVESWYHTNGGNLRKGLVTVRRALTTAQLMGLHRPGRATCKCADRQTKAYPEFVWFRINSLERYLCLMLGLPQATLDNSMASEANLLNDTPMGRLDRIHCAVTSRILERNQSNLEIHDFGLTRELDEELQRASRDLPAKWWLTPNLATVADKPQALFWDMRRLFHHLFHYNLLIQLHLPWMLHSAIFGHDSQYSQTICINSAREILSRFAMFHSFNRIAFSCRTVDFFGLMAATTLLAAHIDGHRPISSNPQQLHAINPLVHQRLSDRALVEGIQEIMSEVSRVENDTMSMQLSNILQRLMSIEAAAEAEAMADPDTLALVSGKRLPQGEDSVQLSIPYFGAIEITSRGIVSNDATRAQARQAVATNDQVSSTSGEPLSSVIVGSSQLCQQPDGPGDSDVPGSHDANQKMLINSSTQQQNQGNSSTFSDDVGVLSDIDMAFFDTLMGGTGNEESDGIDWLAWLNDFQLPSSHGI